MGGLARVLFFVFFVCTAAEYVGGGGVFMWIYLGVW